MMLASKQTGCVSVKRLALSHIVGRCLVYLNLEISTANPLKIKGRLTQ
jgi:hypothetical protein